MPCSQMSYRKMNFSKMSHRQMSIIQMSVDQMSIVKISYSLFVFDEMSVGQRVLEQKLWSRKII